jgi:hypothetical protein
MKKSANISFVDKLFMSFIKVFGMYQQLPGGIKLTGGFLFFLFFGPFFPTGYSIYNSLDTLPIFLPIAHFGFYIISTFIIMVSLIRYSKKWEQKDYDNITIDLAVFRFIFFAFLYSMIYFGLFRLTLQML